MSSSLELTDFRALRVGVCCCLGERMWVRSGLLRGAFGVRTELVASADCLKESILGIEFFGLGLQMFS